MALLDAEFVQELELLKRRIETDARSGMSGQRLAARLGSATHFAQHRRYAPGDDLRRIDWLAFARSGQPMLKQYLSDEDTIGRLLIDHSASLGLGSPPKLDAAKRIAGALAYLWLSSGLRCQLIGEAPQRVSAPTPAPVRFFAARRGRRVLPSTLREIESLTASGTTDLPRWIGELVSHSPRPGLLVVLSDFLDPFPVLGALDQARSKGHDIMLIQLLAPEELAPELSGDLELVDAETGQVLQVSIDAASLDAYHQRLDDLCSSLRKWATRRRQTYLRVSSAEELGPVMLQLMSPRNTKARRQ